MRKSETKPTLTFVWKDKHVQHEMDLLDGGATAAKCKATNVAVELKNINDFIILCIIFIARIK